MTVRADLSLYDCSGRLTAVAEIKNRLGTSPEWAALTRRNILAHGEYRSADYFILVTPDRLYLWKDVGTEPVQILPTYEADTQSEFTPYFERAGVDPRHVSGHTFELIVSAWLSDVIRSEGAAEKSTEDRSWLTKSGFRSAVRDGHIEYEALV